MTMKNLPRDLVEEILSRVPVKSIGVVRSTCKTWNALSKDARFANKHIVKAAAAAREKDFLILTAGGSMDYLISVNLYETCNKNFGLSINRKGISIEREHSEQAFFISQAFLSNGLLLCVWRNKRSRLLVWNLYWGKRRWIECSEYYLNEQFAFGYDRSCGSHKILRFSSYNPHMEIYYLTSDSWRSTYDASFNRRKIKYTEPGFSLKGNAYWYATDYESEGGFIHGFDFTRERFGPRLLLPPCSHSGHNVSISSVKEEKLAVLYSPWFPGGVDIWVTNKIEPYEVSWSKFFNVMQRIDHDFMSGRFFIDEEKKVIVVFDMYDNAYYISGESGHFRKVYPRQSPYKRPYIHVGCYVPSSVQI